MGKDKVHLAGGIEGGLTLDACGIIDTVYEFIGARQVNDGRDSVGGV